MAYAIREIKEGGAAENCEWCGVWEWGEWRILDVDMLSVHKSSASWRD